MIRTLFSLSLCIGFALTIQAGQVDAGEPGMAASGDIMIHDAWARASLGKAPNSAAYMQIMNHGDVADTLIGAVTPVAKKAEMHDHQMEDGIAKMRRIDMIEVAPGEPIMLQPGGLHVMLMGLQEKLDEGSTLPMTLIFEHAGEIVLDVPIHGMGGGKKSEKQHQHDG